MSFSVVALKSAEQDAKELKHYIVNNFGKEALANDLGQIAGFDQHPPNPPTRRPPDELGALNPPHYRQIISGTNRITYEIRQQTIYIHIVCDSRREMQGLLNRRVLRGE